MRIPLKWFLLGSAVIAAAIGLGKRYYDDRQWLNAPASAGSREAFDNSRYEDWKAGQEAKRERLKEALRGSYLQWAEYELTSVQITPNTDLNNLSLLEQATSLHELWAKVPLRDEHLLWARNHPNLRRIPEIQGISDRSLAVLGSCPRLEFLLIQQSPITDEGLANLRGLNHLARLYLSDCPITGRGLGALSNLPRLSQLDVVDCPLDEEGIKAIGQLRALEQCTLAGGTFDGTGLRHLGRLSKLNSLFVQSAMLSDTSGLAELDSVQTLSLYNKNSLKPGMLTHVAGMDSLRSLRLDQSNVTEGACRELAEAQQLVFLDLERTSIDDTGLAHLGKLRNLQRLYLRKTQITEDGLCHLECLASLREVLIGADAVTENAVRRLAGALPRAKIMCGKTTIEPTE